MFPEHPHSVAAVLTDTYRQRIEAIWYQLQGQLGLTPRFATPVPHLSFHVAEGYDETHLRERLAAFASRHHRLTIRTAGLGIFTGNSSVLVLMVVRTPGLSAFQETLFNQIITLAERPSPYYTPETWIPHITLSPAPLDTQALIQAIGLLNQASYVWELPLDNLALICDNCGDQGIHYSYPLLPEPGPT